MNAYVKSGISILNDTTKDLKNLNELGIYLAKQTDIDALKSLKTAEEVAKLRGKKVEEIR